MSRHLTVIVACSALLLVSCMMKSADGGAASEAPPTPGTADPAGDRVRGEEGWFGSLDKTADKPEAPHEENTDEEKEPEDEESVEWDAPAAEPSPSPAAGATTTATTGTGKGDLGVSGRFDAKPGSKELRFEGQAHAYRQQIAQNAAEAPKPAMVAPRPPATVRRAANNKQNRAAGELLPADDAGIRERAMGNAMGKKKRVEVTSELAVHEQRVIREERSRARSEHANLARDGNHRASRDGYYDADDREGDDEDGSRVARRKLDLGKSRPATRGAGLLDGLSDVPDFGESERPTSFLPRMAYFENTYLGGNAAHAERVRRLRHELGDSAAWTTAHAPVQPFDAPGVGAISLTATLDKRWTDGPGRVFLQIGLQGSHRFGWRRPPLDVVLVVDAGAVEAGVEKATELSSALMGQLGPQDRLGIVLVGATPVVVTEPVPVRKLRVTLARRLEQARVTRASGAAVGDAIRRAGELLAEAAQNEARVPGSQVVLLAAPAQTGGLAARTASARLAAHELTVQGAITSVIELGPVSDGAWWGVAAAGHGNYHRAGGLDAAEGGVLAAATARELELLSKVVARLLRVNVRLNGKTGATRIIGSRLLGRREVKRVKAREVATDRNLSKTMGVSADRGSDDDGLQTLVPYYYGGDSHVILVELWVEGPGAVAEVTLKYKDMVQLGNATARVGVSLSRTHRADTPAQQVVRRNVRSFEVADALLRAAEAVVGNDRAGADVALDAARGWAHTPSDRVLVDELGRLMDGRRSGTHVVSEALAIAARRRVGLPPTR